MHRQSSERGAALILLIGITAVLAILATMLVTALATQQRATAMERTRKTTQEYAEGALDQGLTLAKTRTISELDPAWLMPGELLQAFKEGFPGGVLPEGMTVQYFIYDNSGVRLQYSYDANADGMMWIEVLLTYRGKSSRMRVLLRQSQEALITAFPKAVVYSDTGIRLLDSSDVYAVEDDGITPYAHAGQYATTIMAGGGWVSGWPSSAKNFEANGTANLAAPTSSVQSVNVQVNGVVSPAGHFQDNIPGGVGLLSDYFDQAAQADLGDEAQAGESHAIAPTAPGAPSTPVAPTPTPSPTLSTTDVSNITNSSTTTAYTTYQNTSVKTKSSTDITINRATARTLYFKDLYVRGSLSVTGPVTLVVTGYLRVDGTVTLNNTGSAVTDTISGRIFAAGTGQSSVAGNVTLNTPSLYAAGTLALSNTSTTAPVIYSGGAMTTSGSGSVAASTSLASGGAMTLGNASTTAGALRSAGNLSLTGNTTVSGATLYAGGTLSASGSTATRTDQFTKVFIAGTGTSSTAGLLAFNATESIYCAGSLTLGSSSTTTPLLFVADNLVLSGNTTTSANATIVLGGTDHSTSSKDFVVSGATSPVVHQLGRLWVKGYCDWSGTASIRTTYYTDPSLAAAPMYLGLLARSGTYADVYGPTWCTGNAGTSDVAVEFVGPASGTATTVMCPLLATTEKTEITGRVNFGSRTNPMVYYMMCDNDTLYSNTMLLGDSGSNAPYLGTFNGLMVVMEATMEIYSNSGITPCVLGAIFNGTTYKSGTSPSAYDITLRSSASVAYSQSILDAVTNTAITTTTRVTQIVPGSWQQLPVN
jgi:hypothetical protein